MIAGSIQQDMLEDEREREHIRELKLQGNLSRQTTITKGGT